MSFGSYYISTTVEKLPVTQTLEADSAAGWAVEGGQEEPLLWATLDHTRLSWYPLHCEISTRKTCCTLDLAPMLVSWS